MQSEFYRALMPYSRQGGALPAVFTTRDESLHKTLKAPVAPLFSLSNILTLEPHVDKTIQVLVGQWDSRFLDSQVTFDLADWLSYFAFDVMGTLTFSKRYGFLEEGRDVGGMIKMIFLFLKTAAPVGHLSFFHNFFPRGLDVFKHDPSVIATSAPPNSENEKSQTLTRLQMTQVPWFDTLWYKNSFAAWLRGPNGSSILKIVGKHTSERLEASKSHLNGNTKYGSEDRDMLSQFIDLAAKNPDLPPW